MADESTLTSSLDPAGRICSRIFSPSAVSRKRAEGGGTSRNQGCFSSCLLDRRLRGSFTMSRAMRSLAGLEMPLHSGMSKSNFAFRALDLILFTGRLPCGSNGWYPLRATNMMTPSAHVSNRAS